MKNGYFKLQRKFFSHWLWEGERTYSEAEAFLDLLQLAAFKPTKRKSRGKFISIDEGEQIASLRFLSVRWKWGKTKVSNFLNILEEDLMIKREARQGETVLIVNNYKRYASKEEIKADKDEDTGETVTRHRRDKLEEGKERKETISKPPAIAWDACDGYSNISDKDILQWKEAYPACDIERQLKASNEWLLSNPAKAKKKQWRRFITGWLSRQQERGGDAASNKSATPDPPRRNVL